MAMERLLDDNDDEGPDLVGTKGAVKADAETARRNRAAKDFIIIIIIMVITTFPVYEIENAVGTASCLDFVMVVEIRCQKNQDTGISEPSHNKRQSDSDIAVAREPMKINVMTLKCASYGTH